MNNRSEAWRSRRVWIGLLLILALALFLRLYALDQIPDILGPDEADNAQDALRVLAGRPPDGGFFGLDWKPQPAFSIYLISFAMRLFGEGVFALRLPNALIGACTLIPFFALVRRQATPTATLAAAFLLATSLWHLHFSRSGWENVQVGCYALGAMACYMHAIDLVRGTGARRRAWAWFGAGGLFCALGLYSYFSGRLILLVLLVASLPLLRERVLRRDLLIGFAITALTAVVLFVPMLPIMLSDWAFFNLRASTVFITTTPDFSQHAGAVIVDQVVRNSAAFWDGSINKRVRYLPKGEPLLDLITRLLVLGGIIRSLAVARLRLRLETWMWLALLVIGWVSTQVLTIGTPNAARAIIFLPALYWLVALSIDWLIQSVRVQNLVMRVALGVLGIVLLLGLAGSQISNYVAWQLSDEFRAAQQPAITLDELPEWTATIKARAQRGQDTLAVSDWRAQHGGQVVPSTDLPPAPAVPAPAASAPAADTPQEPALRAQVIDPPEGPPEAWIAPKASFAAQVASPRAIASDKAGAIYVLDGTPAVQTITRYTPTGQVLARWGGPGTPDQDGRFVEAWGLAIDQAGEALVLDASTGFVHVFDLNGTFLRKWGADLRMYKPRAIAVGPDGTIYIADTGGRRALALHPDGSLLHSYGDQRTGATGAAQLLEPAGVAATADGTVLVADAPAGVIRLYAPEGRLIGLWTIGAETAADGPRLAMLPDGAVLVTQPTRCALLWIAANATTARRSGNCDQTGYLSLPSGVAAQSDGSYLVSDAGRGQIIRYQP